MNASVNARSKIVLLVEDIPESLESGKTALVNQGYTVLPAASYDEALAIAKNKWFHVAIIDSHLEGPDDQNPKTFAGFELACNSLLSIYPCILYTAYRDDTAREMVKKFVGRELPKNVTVKMKGESSITDVVDEVFRLSGEEGKIEVGINFKQKIGPVGAYALLEQLGLGDRFDESYIRLAAELQDLFGKAFVEYDRLTTSLLSKGGSGSIALLVTPQRDDYPEAPLIVKYGPRRSTQVESKNYRDHVSTIYTSWVAHLIEDRPTETLNFGLLKYRIADGDITNTLTFAEFYQRSNTEAIGAAIKHLFQNARRNWYNPTVPRSPKEEYISRFYEQRVLFGSRSGPPVTTEVLWGNIKGLIQSVISASAGLVDLRESEGNLHWQVGGREFVWPEPHAYMSRIRGQESPLFPKQYTTCRCHGDLHSENILVDRERYLTWLIDFEHTGWGPLLQDAIELESSILFRLADEPNLERLFLLMETLALQSSLTGEMTLDPSISESAHSTLWKAFETIRVLRSEASKIDGAKIEEYLLGLVYQSLRIVKSSHSQSGIPGRSPHFSRIQALFFASVCCQQLRTLSAMSLDKHPEKRVPKAKATQI